MSDPEDKIDQHRDNALNGLIRTIEATGGLVSISGKDIGLSSETVFVPKGDTEREWTDLADAYLEACKAMDVVPLIDGKRAPKILKVIIQLARSAKDEISDEENDSESAQVHLLAETFPKEITEVHVVDCNNVFLYYADGREG